jgi:hypothetical protein
LIDRIRQALDPRAGHARDQIAARRQAAQLTERDVRRDVLTAVGSELARLYADGIISAATCLKLQRAFDLEHSRYSSDAS